MVTHTWRRLIATAQRRCSIRAPFIEPIHTASRWSSCRRWKRQLSSCRTDNPVRPLLPTCERTGLSVLRLAGQAVDSVHRQDEIGLFGLAAELHQVGIFRRVVVELVEHAGGLESARAEENLGGEIRFAYFDRDARAALTGKLAAELLDHLAANTTATEVGGDSEVQNVQPRFVQLVDHEADDAFGMLGHHSNAIALSQTADELLFEPREFKSGALDIEDLGHVSSDHPTNVNTKLRLVVDRHVASFHVGLRVMHMERAAKAVAESGNAKYQMRVRVPSRKVERASCRSRIERNMATRGRGARLFWRLRDHFSACARQYGSQLFRFF